MHDLNASHQPSTIHNSQALWHVLLALLFLLAVFTSCNQAKDDPAPKVPKIKTITHGTSPNSDKEFYEYDSMGRLKSITITGHEPNHIQYIYLKDQIIVQSEADITQNILYFNDKGLVTIESFGMITHEYDANGYSKHTIGYNPDGKIGLEYQYQVSDGNKTVLKLWQPVNKQLVQNITWEYEFLPNSVNTIGNENMGITFYGKQDNNLVSVETERYTGSEFSDQRHYYYEMDAKNRVVKRWIENYPETGDVYTYYE